MILGTCVFILMLKPKESFGGSFLILASCHPSIVIPPSGRPTFLKTRFQAMCGEISSRKIVWSSTLKK